MHRRFRKYGNIESTEVLRSGKECYVTFICDLSTCLAFDREKHERVEVAYTWHQPRKVQPEGVHPDQPTHAEAASPIFKLNDHCLFLVFDLCDSQSLVNLSETSKRFNTLLTKIYNFPNNKKFDLHDLLPLDVVRKIVRLMGVHFQIMHLDLSLSGMANDIVYGYFRTILKYSKTNTVIREVKIQIDDWNKDLNKMFTPIFQNLQTLELRCCNLLVCEDNNDPTILLPNLKTLIVNQPAEFVKIRAPNLETFHLQGMSDYLLRYSSICFPFFAASPQIKIFKCDFMNMYDLQSLSVQMPNVEKLSFCLLTRSSNNFIHFKKFKHLTKLKLQFSCIVNLIEAIKILGEIKSLLELKLYLSRNTISQHVMLFNSH